MNISNINTAGSVNYTANQIINGFILRDLTGDTTDTLPSAASIISTGSLSLNSVVKFFITNINIFETFFR